MGPLEVGELGHPRADRGVSDLEEQRVAGGAEDAGVPGESPGDPPARRNEGGGLPLGGHRAHSRTPSSITGAEPGEPLAAVAPRLVQVPPGCLHGEQDDRLHQELQVGDRHREPLDPRTDPRLNPLVNPAATPFDPLANRPRERVRRLQAQPPAIGVPLDGTQQMRRSPGPGPRRGRRPRRASATARPAGAGPWPPPARSVRPSGWGVSRRRRRRPASRLRRAVRCPPSRPPRSHARRSGRGSRRAAVRDARSGASGAHTGAASPRSRAISYATVAGQAADCALAASRPSSRPSVSGVQSSWPESSRRAPASASPAIELPIRRAVFSISASECPPFRGSSQPLRQHAERVDLRLAPALDPVGDGGVAPALPQEDQPVDVGRVADRPQEAGESLDQGRLGIGEVGVLRRRPGSRPGSAPPRGPSSARKSSSLLSKQA